VKTGIRDFSSVCRENKIFG